MQVRLKVFDSNNGQRIGYAEAIAGYVAPCSRSFFSIPSFRRCTVIWKVASYLPLAQIMDMSGNSSNEASDSDDSFDESNRRYEDIILRAGQHGTGASGANGW